MTVMDLLHGIATTRAIRRYTEEPVTDEQLATVLFAASRAPSGSNRQPFRFVVLRDGPRARQAKAIIGEAARTMWSTKRRRDGYGHGSGRVADSPKARTAVVLDRFVDRFEEIPVVILPCAIRYRPPNPYEGASVYPAVQNLLLAARAIGLGGTLTTWQAPVEPELRSALDIPDEVFIAGTVTLGHPEGSHGPVRRRPLAELVYEQRWGRSPAWALDPPGTRHTTAGPPTAPGATGP